MVGGEDSGEAKYYFAQFYYVTSYASGLTNGEIPGSTDFEILLEKQLGRGWILARSSASIDYSSSAT